MKKTFFAMLFSIGICLTGPHLDVQAAAGLVPEDQTAVRVEHVDLSGEIIQEGGSLPEADVSGGRAQAPGEDTGNLQQAEEAIIAAWDSFAETCDLSSYQITPEGLRSIYFATVNEHPRYFYVGSTYSCYMSGPYVETLLIKYSMDSSEAAPMLEAYDRAVADLVKGADLSWSDMEKALYINDQLARDCRYDTSYSKYTAYDALVGKTAVCQGYALAFLELAGRLGLSCEMVTSGSLDHAWNMVKLGDVYYHVDVTWNDPIADRLGRARHQYFMKSTAYFKSEDGGHLEADDWVISGGVEETAASETRYDDHFWNKVDVGFEYISGHWYGFDGDNSICRYTYDGTDLTVESTLQEIKDIWPVIGGTGYWQGTYVGTGAFDGKFYYSGSTDIYECDVETGTKTVLSTLTDEQKERGSIYGMRILSSGEVEYILAATPNESGEILTAQTLSSSTPQTDVYCIRFNGNGADSGSMEDVGWYESGREYVLPDDQFIKAGRVFSGWNTKADGSGISYGNGASICYTPAFSGETLTLYAQWTEEHTHTIIKVEAVPATCTESGKTEGSRCSVCGADIIEQQTIPATGHDWKETYVVDIPATIEKDGEKSIHCRKCEARKDIQNIPRLDQEHEHTPEKDEAVPATCTKDGKTRGSHCGECGVVIEEQQTIPATGHDWEATYTVDIPATAESEGQRSIHCRKCEERKNIELIDRLEEGQEQTLDGLWIQLEVDEFVYDGTEKRPAVMVKNEEMVLPPSFYDVAYSSNIHAGTATVTVTGKAGYTGTLTERFQIQKAKNKITATAGYHKTAKKSAQTFRLNVRATGGRLTFQSDDRNVKVDKYGKVTVAKNFVGRAIITAKASGADHQSTSFKITVRIDPAGTTISKLRNLRGRKVSIKWKKNTQVSGYQIQYATDRRFSGARTKTIAGKAKTGKTYTGFAKRKTYYVRIRTYKTVGGVKYYSAWSTGVRSVKIKR